MTVVRRFKPEKRSCRHSGNKVVHVRAGCLFRLKNRQQVGVSLTQCLVLEKVYTRNE